MAPLNIDVKEEQENTGKSSSDDTSGTGAAQAVTTSSAARPELGPVFGQPVSMQPYQPPPNGRFGENPQARGIPVAPYIPLDRQFRKSTSPLFQAFMSSHDKVSKGEVA